MESPSVPSGRRTESSHSGDDPTDPGPQKPRFDQPTTDALGVWQMGLFALPLLMTGEEVRDIAWRRSRAVDPAGGEWGQGLGGGQVAVIAARPDGRLRHGRG